MKRSRTGKKRTIYVQATLENEKKRKSTRKAGAGAGALDKKEKHILDGSRPAASTILSEAGRTARSKFFKATGSLCFTHEVGIRNLADEHKLGVGEDLSKNVHFSLADPS